MKTSTLVGSVFFVVLFASLYFAIFHQRSSKQPTEHILLRLPTADGIKIGTSVNILGGYSGFVSYLHFYNFDAEGRPIQQSASIDEIEGQAVLVVLDVFEKPDLTEDYQVLAVYPELFGEKSLEIRPGSNDGDLLDFITLTDREYINFRQDGTLPPGEILIGENFEDPVFILSQIIEENREDIQTITKNMALITGKINHGNGAVSVLLNDSDLHDALLASMREAVILTRDLREDVEALRETGATIDLVGAFLLDVMRLTAGVP